jgi:hypothetical protein
MQTALLVLIVLLLVSLFAAVLGYLLRPRPKDDVMQQAIGDAPAGGFLIVQDGIGREFNTIDELKAALANERLPRGGYASMPEREPIIHSRARSLGHQESDDLRGRAGAGSEV